MFCVNYLVSLQAAPAPAAAAAPVAEETTAAATEAGGTETLDPSAPGYSWAEDDAYVGEGEDLLVAPDPTLGRDFLKGAGSSSSGGGGGTGRYNNVGYNNAGQSAPNGGGSHGVRHNSGPRAFRDHPNSYPAPASTRAATPPLNGYSDPRPVAQSAGVTGSRAAAAAPPAPAIAASLNGAAGATAALPATAVEERGGLAGGADREDDGGVGAEGAAAAEVTAAPAPALAVSPPPFVDLGIEGLTLPSMRGPFEDKVEGVQVRM